MLMQFIAGKECSHILWYVGLMWTKNLFLIAPLVLIQSGSLMDGFVCGYILIFLWVEKVECDVCLLS